MPEAKTRLGEILGAVYRKDLAALRRATPQDLNLRDQDGRTPLMHAILAEDADPSIVQLLIDHGADVNINDNGQKWTPLHFAARDQNEPLVRILLNAAAAVDPVDVFGNTPLWRSVMNSTSSLSAMAELLKHGADPDKKNNHGSSPMDVARDTGRTDIVALFERDRK
jgi:ankyrin repeat protein